MPLSLKPERLQRYREIAKLFVKYGRGDLARSAGFPEGTEDPVPEDRARADAASAAFASARSTISSRDQIAVSQHRAMHLSEVKVQRPGRAHRLEERRS